MESTTKTLEHYQHAVYRCITRARDALFDLCDALATYPSADPNDTV